MKNLSTRVRPVIFRLKHSLMFLRSRKTLIIAIILLNTLSVQAQDCDLCMKVLDASLMTTSTNFNRDEFSSLLEQYFESDENQRSVIKKKSSNSTTIGAVIKSIPTKLENSNDYKSGSEHIYDLYINWKSTGKIDQTLLAYSFSAEMPTAAFQAFETCVKNNCGRLGEKALGKVQVDWHIIDETNARITLINNMPGKIDVVKMDVSGGGLRKTENIHPGVKLRTQSTLTDLLGRNSNKDLFVTIHFRGFENSQSISITIPKSVEKKEGNKNVPIGAIVISTLTYDQFLTANGIERTTDLAKILWLPCDGRPLRQNLNETNYLGNFLASIPDLRGVFIRGANAFGDESLSEVDEVDENMKNPDNKNVGEFQDEQFKSHFHTTERPVFGHRNDKFPLVEDMDGGNWGGYMVVNTDSKGGNETRPKNLTVNYYIKVR